jgi:hypothetical protein
VVVVALALAAGAAAPARAAEFSVSTTGDSGPGSLRQAVLSANGTPGADTITVVTAGTVSLGSSLPDLSDDVTISGPGANTFAVARGAAMPFRLFTVDPGVSATIAGLGLSGGDAGGASSGGGAVLNQGVLALRNVKVTGNTAAVEGGGVSSRDATLSIEGSTIAGNTVAGGSSNFYGGGVFVDGQGSATISASTISGNSATGAQSGGGGGIGLASNATLAVSNSTISGNQARDRGGGIGQFFGPARITLTSVTLAANGAFPNQSVTGANLYIEGSGANAAAASFINTLVGVPLGPNAVNCAGKLAFSLISFGHNLDSGTSCAFTQASDITSVDPRLGSLADNGGPTLTRALQPGSLAIDAGTGAGLATDQRGVVRPQGPASDIGAFEVQVTPPSPAPPSQPAAPGPPPPITLAAPKPTLIESPIRTFWTVTRRGTRVLEMAVRQLPAGAAVGVRCAGKGCPFGSKRAKINGTTANLKPLFRNRLLRTGAVVEVRITAPNRIGKVSRFTIRRGKLPTTKQLCLPPGTNKPKNRC